MDEQGAAGRTHFWPFQVMVLLRCGGPANGLPGRDAEVLPLVQGGAALRFRTHRAPCSQVAGYQVEWVGHRLCSGLSDATNT